MRLSRTVLALLGVLLTALVTTPPVLAEPDLHARVDTAVAATLADMGVPGAIVGLSVPGRLDYIRALGVADTASGRAMTIDDHTRIGSVTKTFTGTVVLQLVDEGRIRLSDPISQYVAGVPSGDEITLDMLGRMRSGLVNYTEEDEFASGLFTESPAGPYAFTPSVPELLGLSFRRPLNFPPGSRFEYSNTNTLLLGLVIEKVTGSPLDQVLRQRVLEPLGLTQTTYPDNGFMPEPYARGYAKIPDGTVGDSTLWNPSWAGAAGEIVSNYADLAVWARAVGRGDLLTPATQASRMRMQDGFPGATYGFALLDSGGWVGHGGTIPGYTTIVAYLPDADATLVVLVNSNVPAKHAASQIATAVTSLATQDHVFYPGI